MDAGIGCGVDEDSVEAVKASVRVVAITGFRPVLTWTSAADTPQAVRAALGARRADLGTWVVPAEATYRRTLARVDPVALARVVGAWLAADDRPGPGPGRCPRRALAVDVTANQPLLLERCASLAWRRVRVLDRTRDRGHGRVELRTLKAVSVRHFGFPHAAQVIQVTRAVGALSRAGPVNLAAALRHHSRDPARPLATLGIAPS